MLSQSHVGLQSRPREPTPRAAWRFKARFASLSLFFGALCTASSASAGGVVVEGYDTQSHALQYESPNGVSFVHDHEANDSATSDPVARQIYLWAAVTLYGHDAVTAQSQALHGDSDSAEQAGAPAAHSTEVFVDADLAVDGAWEAGGCSITPMPWWSALLIGGFLFRGRSRS